MCPWTNEIISFLNNLNKKEFQMKTILSLLILTVTSMAFASQTPELCVLESEHQEEIDNQFQETFIDVEEVRSLNKGLVRHLNYHIQALGYSNKPLNLNQIKNLFTKGEQSFNDLYLKIFVSKITGQKLIEVVSFPGDNPYSHLFNGRGDLVGFSGDGSYAFLTGGKPVYCYDLKK